MAGGMAVHIRTSRHENARFYDQTVQLRFPAPTADSLSLINAAMSGLERIYRPGFGYAKAGVMLFDLEAEGRLQGSLLVPENAERRQRRERLMASLDAINRRFGRDAVAFGAQGLGEDPLAYAPGALFSPFDHRLEGIAPGTLLRRHPVNAKYFLPGLTGPHGAGIRE